MSKVALPLLVLVAGLASVPAGAVPIDPPLLRAADPRCVSRYPAGSSSLRERLVTLSSATIGSSPRIRLNLFPDVDVVAVRQRLDRRPGGKVTWLGRIDGSPMSSVVLSVDGDRVVGSVLLPGSGSFRILPDADGLHSVRQVETNREGGCAADSAAGPDLAALVRTGTSGESPRSAAGADPVTPTFAPDDGSVVDLMVLYTPEALAASPGIVAEIETEVAAVNQAYVNTGIPMSLRLVHTGVTSTGDSGNSTTDLVQMWDPDDGINDEIHPLRDAKCADLVTLITETGSACGVAFVMANVTPGFAAFGFSAVQRGCFGGGIVLGHELGHNMAARHDWDVDPTDFGPYTYNHGYVCPCNNWHDIMAYGNACGGCGAIPYFSNPDITYGGLPLGVPEGTFRAADVRKTFNNTRPTVANFRTSAVCRILALDTPSRTLTDSPDGNADGMADPGESVTMAIDLHDGESFAVTGISAVVTTATPGITISDGNVTWADLAAGATAASQAPHVTFHVASSVACGTVITFNLAVTAEEGTFAGSFPVTVGCTPWCNDPVFAGASAVTDLASCLDTGVLISWNPAQFGAAPLGYEVRRYSNSNCNGGETVLATGLFSTSFVDDVSPNNTDRWYKVFAANDCGRVSDGGACTGPGNDVVTTLTAYAWVSPNPVVEGTQQGFFSSVSGGVSPYTFAWDFTNDGTPDAATQNANFTYPAGAFYTWRFRVTDAAGCFLERTGQATVNTPPFNTCAINVSDSAGSDDNPRVHQGKAVWSKQLSGTNFEIYHWDGSTSTRLTNNTLVDRNACISNGRVAWEAYDSAVGSGSAEIYTWIDGTATRLTNNNNLDQNPIMDNGQILWERSWASSPYSTGGLGFFDGTTVHLIDPHDFAHANASLHQGKASWTRVANSYRQVFYWNGSFPAVPQQVTNLPGDKTGTSIYNGKIAWSGQVGTSGPYQVFYWDGSTITQLTNTAGNNLRVKLTGDNLAFWMGHDGNDWEIFRWDGTTVTQLTDNTTHDGYPAPVGGSANIYFDAHGDTAVWPHYDGNDGEIYFWDGTSVRALSNNISSDIAPVIRDRQIVWMQPFGANGFDVMYWQQQRADVNNLRLSAPETATWDHTPCAAPPSYRVIRGNVANLGLSGGVVDLGSVTCEVAATPNNNATVAGSPPDGETWFYLVKEEAATEYGWSSSYQPENPASGGCP